MTPPLNTIRGGSTSIMWPREQAMLLKLHDTIAWKTILSPGLEKNFSLTAGSDREAEG